MAIASMSQIFQGRQGRREYLRRQCACRRGGALVADGEPLRALLVYALTGAEGGQDVAVRMNLFASGDVCAAGEVGLGRARARRVRHFGSAPHLESDESWKPLALWHLR